MTVRERLGGWVGILMLVVVVVAFVYAIVLYSALLEAVAFVSLIVWLVYVAARPGPNDPPKRRWRDSRRSR